MNLYLIERIGEPDYREMTGCVVREATGHAARLLAATGRGRLESASTWTDPSRSTLTVLARGVKGGPAVVLRDFSG